MVLTWNMPNIHFGDGETHFRPFLSFWVSIWGTFSIPDLRACGVMTGAGRRYVDEGGCGGGVVITIFGLFSPLFHLNRVVIKGCPVRPVLHSLNAHRTGNMRDELRRDVQK